MTGMQSMPTCNSTVTGRKGMLTPAAVWVNLENPLLSERSQTQNATLCDPMYTGRPEQTKPLRQGAGWAVDWAGGWGDRKGC